MLQGIIESLVGIVMLCGYIHITYISDREREAALKDGLEQDLWELQETPLNSGVLS